jgi:hypothetical protein
MSQRASMSLNAAMEIVMVVDRMIQANQLFRAFWVCLYLTL